ncbi:glycoside hydrolase family 5 protein [Croceivirga thetidis]|uniref:Glycoside hydrolase family 5 protein n=1 Tax=Croceivirga thetidis TaxID=2721623 RepID=A0ABX1GMQ4_9FLAO|nr:glycoside hydrolase family 5 protein [Croceivirga thetidis]NKI30355.1 glycoside hydrolase family 5 protein [Croceivirga thetidis]
MNKKFVAPITSILFVLFFWIACSSSDAGSDTVPDTQSDGMIDTDDDGTSGDDTVDFDTSSTASALVAQMGVGWNLGNSFDVENRDKTFWGNPLPTKAMIDLVASAGFKTLRIPVTWGYHQSITEPFTIEQDYINRVQKVVDYGIENDLFVIINVHHDDDWVQLVSSEKEYVKSRLSSLWQQVATHFKDYNEQLIFDILNEPRLKGTSLEWTGGDAESRSILNEYHQVGVDAVRATGGNNTSRFLMVSTYAASTLDGPMNDLVIPNNDPNIIISLHTYFPWSFAGDENGPTTWGSADERAALNTEMDRIRQKWQVEEGREVILGEWGTRNKGNLSERVEYAQFYAEASLSRGFVPVVWDDGGNFMLQNRNTTSWQFPDIVNAIINASN